jgi:hypothetical protein
LRAKEETLPKKVYKRLLQKENNPLKAGA